MSDTSTAASRDLFANFPTGSEIRSRWRGDRERPVVSLVGIAYQHARFVVDALRGMVEQRTDFPFEILCYDDCSSDGTRDILIEFAERYPDLVRLVLPETNQFSLGRKPFFDTVTPLCRGQFIARIECDDYWSDPLKIQKQVDFLRDNPDYVLVTHDVCTIDEAGAIVNEDWLPKYWKRDFDEQDLRLGWCMPTTHTVLYRNVIRDIPEEMRKTPSGDSFLGSMLGSHGKAKYLADIGPSMYRQHDGGIFSPLSSTDKIDVQTQGLFWLYRYYKRIGMPLETRFYRLRFVERSLREVSPGDVLKLLRLRFGGANAKNVLTFRGRRRSGG